MSNFNIFGFNINIEKHFEWFSKNTETEILDLSRKNLRYLPDLSKFKNLKN